MTLGTKWTGLFVEVVVDSRASTSPPDKEGQVEEVVELVSVEI